MSNARDKANIPVLNFQSKGIDDNADATAITINSSENVLINTTSASGFDSAGLPLIVGSGSTHQGLTIFSGTSHQGAIHFADGTGTSSYRGQLNYKHDADAMTFATSGAEKARFDSSGRLLVGKTVTTRTVAGAELRPDGFIRGTKDSSHAFDCVRTTDDGDVIRLYKDNTHTGSIGVAGSNPFLANPNSRGISLGSNVVPCDNAGSAVNNLSDLGTSSARFKDLYLSGDIIVGDSHTIGDDPSDNLEIKSSSNEGIIYNSANGLHLFEKNSTEVMRIDTNGNVGIGNSGPGRNLSINGSTQTSFVHFTNTGTGTTDTDGLLVGNDNQGSYFINRENSFTAFMNNNSEKMRINSSGNVGIGTSSPSGTLEVRGSASDTSQLYISTSTKPNTRIGYIGLNRFGMDIYDGLQIRDVSASYATRFVIASNGDAYFNKTSDSFSTTGVGILNTSQVQFVASNQGLLYCNRLNSDGQLAIFFQNGTEEGAISVSGSTVSYSGFTGTHWSRFQDNSTPTILRGTVLETLDEMCDWYNLEFDVIKQDENGNDVTTSEKIPHVLLDSQSDGDVITYNHKGTDYQATIVKEVDVKHMKSKVSDTVDAKNVYGLFVAYDLDGEGYNDFYVASVGSYVVRIKQGETIAKGDLLQSNGDGTAKVQTDDNVKSSSFAKVLSTTIIETYEDGSYLVPCSLNC